MKQQDVLVIVAVVIFSVIASFVVSNLVFAPSPSKQQQVERVDAITAEFPDPKVDSRYTKYFNSNAFDPALPIEIGDNNNDNPFNGSGQ